MGKVFSSKINLLKALAIMIVVAGHLEFSLVPLFPPYSFQVLLFFFIAGILFKKEYGFFEYCIRRIKSLLIPYFLYAFFYLGLTKLIAPFIGKFWGVEIGWYNELILPFLTGHQIDLISPLWFVPCLFIVLIIYKFFSLIKLNNSSLSLDYIKLLFYLILAFLAIYYQEYAQNIEFLWIFRTAFALFFVHLGYLYRRIFIERMINFNLFSPKIFGFVIILQSLLWLTNQDYTAQDGIGLHFLLVWGQYNNLVIPILTSLTGIWICLFIVEIIYPRVKNWSFLAKIGENSYHIMANHLLIFNILTYSFLLIKGIDFDIKNNSDIYWFYSPLKTTYFYFVIGIITNVYIGEYLKKIRRCFGKYFNKTKNF